MTLQSHLPAESPPSRRDTSSNRAFGAYDLVARLGVGGMGEAFLAAWGGGGQFRKLCVLKRLHANLATEGFARSRFEQEACIAARLNHPNVVQTYDAGDVKGVPYLAMEYLDGQTLRSFTMACATIGIQPDPLVWVRVVADALSGLEHVHDLRDFDGSPLNVIHRDVSPHNIFVTYAGRVALIDFGMLKIISGEGPLACRTLAGKPRYMAPEYVTNGTVDRRTDLFSMGVVLWEAIAGQPMPVAEISPEGANRPRPRLSSLVPDVDPALEAIVTCAVEVDPDLRYPTARAMREALEAYLEVAGPAPRREHIGELLAAYFSEERARAQEVIAAHMDDEISVGEGDFPSDRWVAAHRYTGSEDSRVRVFPCPLGAPPERAGDRAQGDAEVHVGDPRFDADDATPRSFERPRPRPPVPPPLPARAHRPTLPSSHSSVP